MHARPLVRLVLLAGLAASAAGCDTIRQASGGGKDSPDEFAVVTKAPLVIPPDFNLRPPQPGTEPINQVEPTVAAQSALFNADPATVAAALPTTMSQGERYLLAYAHVQDADPAIRQTIASDTNGMRGSDDAFTDSILFGSSNTAAAPAPVDADAEARRLDAARAGTMPAAPPPSARPAPQADAPPADNSDDDDGSVFDHLWPF